MQTVMKHASYKSNENINKIFQAMFPDSIIAKSLLLVKEKQLTFVYLV